MQDIKYLHCQFVSFIGLVSLFFSLLSYFSVSSSCADSGCPFFWIFSIFCTFSPTSSCFWSLFWCQILDVCDFLASSAGVSLSVRQLLSALVFFMSYLVTSSFFSSHVRRFCLPLFWCPVLCVLVWSCGDVMSVIDLFCLSLL